MGSGFIAETGSWILRPRRFPHTLWNPDDRPARILEIITPAGLEEMFAKFGQLGARGERTPDTMGATAAEHGPRRQPIIVRPAETAAVARAVSGASGGTIRT